VLSCRGWLFDQTLTDQIAQEVPKSHSTAHGAHKPHFAHPLIRLVLRRQFGAMANVRAFGYLRKHLTSPVKTGLGQPDLENNHDSLNQTFVPC
jgi:hypothetical protein